jgi:transcriptional regulator with XRE-family HTH domain
MNKIGFKLWTIRQQRKLSLRQVEKLTTMIADRYGDKSRKISASWLGRIEREDHSITHQRLESLEEAYGVSHEELGDEMVHKDEITKSLHSRFPHIPAAVLKGLTCLGDVMLPPESWLAYFSATTLLPALSQNGRNGCPKLCKSSRGGKPLFGVLGANDTTLLPLVQPGAIVEINPSIRQISPTKIFHSIFERPIYFLRSHDGYHCGWCDLDVEQTWLVLVPSAMTMTSHRRWRYRQEVEVVGIVNRVLTRFGFPKNLRANDLSPDKNSNPP